jgi:hypothetical protein
MAASLYFPVNNEKTGGQVQPAASATNVLNRVSFGTNLIRPTAVRIAAAVSFIATLETIKPNVNLLTLAPNSRPLLFVT